jgi:hypothetical protein
VNDTPPDIERQYREMLLQRSGEERLKMGCSMHATAQALVRASVLKVRPTTTSAELRQALFLRFYGRDFGHEATAKILLALGRETLSG